MTIPATRMTSDELADHLLAIRTASGVLTPKAVVSAAEADDHPLHRFFDWDDTVAAQKWRLEQARGLIRRVKINVIDHRPAEIVTVRVRRIVHVNNELNAYVPIEDVVNDDAMSDLVMEQIRRDLASLRRKYAAFQHLFHRAIQLEFDIETG